MKQAMCMTVMMVSAFLSMQVFSQDKGIVSYVGYFDFCVYAPLSEDNIEEVRDRYEISKEDFLFSIIGKSDGSYYYNHGDIRAKIIFNANDVYFVNKRGVARHGEDFYAIDKGYLHEHLVLTHRRNSKGVFVPLNENKESKKSKLPASKKARR